MKKIIILSVFTVITFSLLNNCSKFLDLDPPYTQDAENFFNNEDDYLRALMEHMICYRVCMFLIGRYIASDNCITGGESVTDTEGLHQIDEMTHGAVNLECRSVMRYNYCGIARCNFIRTQENNVEFNGKDVILAEARFLRAFYYFELVKFFGDVPLVIDQRLGVEEVSNLQRTPKSEVYVKSKRI